MKRIVIVALALALLPGLAVAQTINRSLQGSQDPRGPVGLDSSQSAYFPGHINSFGQVTTATSVTLCAAGSIAANSTDVTGQITEGATTACSVLFGSPFNAAPFCQVTVTSLGAAAPTPGTSVAITTRTTGFNLVNGASGNIYTYLCLGGQGG